MGINVAAYRYAHTLAGGAFAGVGGATFSLAITPQWVDGLTQRRRLDRDRPRHLRLLAARAVSRRRVLLRRLLRRCRSRCRRGASRVAPRALPGAAVRDDDRRARRRVVGRRPPAARRAGPSACPTCARSAERPFVARSGRRGRARAGRRRLPPTPRRRPGGCARPATPWSAPRRGRCAPVRAASRRAAPRRARTSTHRSR